MTYQVLARKWRPQNFADLVGQDHVVRALVNALDQDRVHHAFLFTGTRGVGKTTVARIFARALNCEKGVSSTPCGECRACKDILDGRFLDLIEVDAASRTKVEDTRELLENVQYAPTSGRFKVYLIDEVHMLSTSSFNALLKTLEEPPPQVKFLFATTDPQKLPVTVLSRCLQFNLKRISQAQIEGYLQSITGQEDFSADDDALRLLASAADGSMRDALSLLDQAVAYGAGQARAQDVRAMLGTVQAQQLEGLLQALCAADGEKVWKAAQEMVSHSPDFSRVLGEIAQMFHRAALVQVMPAVEDPDPLVQALARALSAEDLQLYYEIVLHGRRDLDLAPDHRCGFEMTLLRMLAFAPDPGNGSSGGTGQAASASPTPAADAGGASTGKTAGHVGGPINLQANGLGNHQVNDQANGQATAKADPPDARPPAQPAMGIDSPASASAAVDPGAAKAEARRLAASIASGAIHSPTPAAKSPQPAASVPDKVQAAPPTQEASPGPQQQVPARADSEADAAPRPLVDSEDPRPPSSAQESAIEPVMEPAVGSVGEFEVTPQSGRGNNGVQQTQQPSDKPPSHEISYQQPPGPAPLETVSVASPPASSSPATVERIPDPTVDADAGVENPQPAHSWDGIIDSLNLNGTAGVMARNSVLERQGPGSYQLTLDSQMAHLHTPQAEARIREGLSRYFGKNMQLKFVLGELQDQTPAHRRSEATEQRQRDAEAAVDADPLIQSLKQQMGAEIIPGSVRPRDA